MTSLRVGGFNPTRADDRLAGNGELQMSLVLRTIRIMLWVVLLLFIALLLVPRVTPYDLLIVRGGSMEPTIHMGSAILVDRRALALAVGDVATFRDPANGPVTHRVIAIEGSRYVTQGDANNSPDQQPRDPGDVMGTAILSVPYIGLALYFLQLPFVFLGLLTLTGGVLILGEIGVIQEELRRMPRNRQSRDA